MILEQLPCLIRLQAFQFDPFISFHFTTYFL
uniref:Uncharacterized protein n=1 Tax=Arundo donax TaxID=35708 RepID=A0A0A9UKQ2_ARUDO